MAVTKKTTSKTTKWPMEVQISLTEQEKNRPELAKGRLTVYEVKESESGDIHVELEKTQFNQATGEKTSNPYPQIFNPRAWDLFRKNARNLGFTHVRILHAPEGMKKEQLELIS